MGWEFSKVNESKPRCKKTGEKITDAELKTLREAKAEQPTKPVDPAENKKSSEAKESVENKKEASSDLIIMLPSDPETSVPSPMISPEMAPKKKKRKRRKRKKRRRQTPQTL